MPEAPLVICTAGHIDHGKSRLVLALTGVDPDRLPEEKARGMTIDLGFAHGEIDGRDVYFVDVPGHERFIRNMVAGAWGVDAALLVVAADDSVMPQTREHVELLALLGIDRCLVAITKMDLVDDEWADAVQEEIAELLDALGIARLGVVRTSAQTGRGIDELCDALRRLPTALAAPPDISRPDAPPPDARSCAAWFRTPIDRAFTIRGRGTVVTGTVAHGAVHRDDELELWRTGGQIGPSPGAPLGELVRRVRVRDLQTHADARESATGRMRLAVNLAGVALEEVERGFELAAPGYLTPSNWLDVSLDWLRMPGKVRRRRLRCRLHLATAEVLAELRLLGTPTDDGPYRGFAQIRAAVPIVSTWGQRFIIRDESARATLGGGRVLRCVSRPWSARRPADESALRTLLAGSAVERAESILRAAAWHPPAPAALAAQAGLADEAEAATVLDRLESEGRLVRLGDGLHACVHVDVCQHAAQRLEPRLREHLDANPRLAGVARGEWKSWMPRACPAELRAALADWLLRSGRFALSDGFIVPRGHRAALSPDDQKLMDAMLAEFAAAGLQPPALAELACRTPRNDKRLRELAELATQRGRLVSIAPDLRLHETAYSDAVAKLTAALRPADATTAAGLTVADIRTLLGSSRKFIVPLLEHLDRLGITRRNGDLRRLGQAGASQGC